MDNIAPLPTLFPSVVIIPDFRISEISILARVIYGVDSVGFVSGSILAACQPFYHLEKLNPFQTEMSSLHYEELKYIIKNLPSQDLETSPS